MGPPLVKNQLFSIPHKRTRYLPRQCGQVIDSVPDIDSASTAGEPVKASDTQGHMVFNNVSFAFPSRPDEPVLRNLNLEIKAGETVALVGPSGCGKSTIIKLLQRFYDPVNGSITLDGRDTRSLRLGSFRGLMGLVSQESGLFATTIFNNIGTSRHVWP